VSILVPTRNIKLRFYRCRVPQGNFKTKLKVPMLVMILAVLIINLYILRNIIYIYWYKNIF